MLVEHSKLLTVAPVWAKFHGCTCIFTNGPCTSGVNDFGVKQGAFYSACADIFQEADLMHLTNSYLFCPLPTDSYHVTALDLINDGNISKITAGAQSRLKESLILDKGGYKKIDQMLKIIDLYPEFIERQIQVTFRFSHLETFGGRVLAIVLEVNHDIYAYLEFKSFRDRLARELEKLLGLQIPTYVPHLTLGYFGNRRSGQLAQASINKIQIQCEQRFAGVELIFDSVMFYTFDSMVRFVAFKDDGDRI